MTTHGRSYIYTDVFVVTTVVSIFSRLHILYRYSR